MMELEIILTRFNQIGAALNRLPTIISAVGESGSTRIALQIIVDCTIELLPGSSAAIYTWNLNKDELDTEGWTTARSMEGLNPAELVQKSVREKTRQIGAGGTEICYPLLASGDALGALYVARPGSQFQEAELLLGEHLASLTAIALAQTYQAALTLQDQVRRERELRRLRKAGMLISSRSSLKDTLDTILKMALEVIDASYGIFRLVDPGGSRLVTQAYIGNGLAKPAIEALPINTSSVMGTVALKRDPVVIHDLREEPWKHIYYPFDHDLEMRSEVAVPLIGASGRLEGVLNLESPDVNAFGKEDRYILQILATQAVIAIQEIRLLDALQDISAMLSTNSLQEIHQALVKQACDLLNVPTSLIWLLEKGQLVVQAASDPGLCGQSALSDTGPNHQVIQTGRSLSLVDGEVNIPYDLELASLKGLGAALIVPLFTSGDPHPVGAFSVYTAGGEKRDFSQSDWDIKVLNILGHYAALAIQNKTHLDALKFAEDQRATTETFAAIGDIAANLLHRLNNKVGTIPVRVEGIQDKCASLLENDPYLAENLAEIQRSASEAMQVVRDSLDHLRPIQLAPVSVSASLREALASIHLPATIEINCHGLDALPPVQAGVNRLALVFSNLIENAADAMEGKGKITFEGSTRDHWVEIRVSDTGPGIPGHLHERIFEFNYSARPSANPGKLGFGLWWVKSLMTRFGGKVTVGSATPTGTTFILSLPQSPGAPGPGFQGEHEVHERL